MTPEPEPPIVAAVIVNGRGRVALVRRRVREGTLSWQFPAGELHDGEPPEIGAARETREEIGLEVTADAIIGQRVHPATGRTMIYVACRASQVAVSVVDTDELDAVEWCTLPELDERVPRGVFGPVRDHLSTAADTLAPGPRTAPEAGADNPR